MGKKSKIQKYEMRKRKVKKFLEMKRGRTRWRGNYVKCKENGYYIKGHSGYAKAKKWEKKMSTRLNRVMRKRNIKETSLKSNNYKKLWDLKGNMYY